MTGERTLDSVWAIGIMAPTQSMQESKKMHLRSKECLRNFNLLLYAFSSKCKVDAPSSLALEAGSTALKLCTACLTLTKKY